MMNVGRTVLVSNFRNHSHPLQVIFVDEEAELGDPSVTQVYKGTASKIFLFVKIKIILIKLILLEENLKCEILYDVYREMVERGLEFTEIYCHLELIIFC